MTIVFDRNDWVALVAFIAGVYIILLTTHVNYKAIHRRLAEEIYLPPAWIYGPLWFALYACIVAAVFIFWKMGDPDSAYYVATFALVIANMALNRMWAPIFFGTSFRYAFYIAAGMALTGAAAVALLGYQARTGSSLLWISFGLLLLYELIVIAAAAYNFAVAFYYKGSSRSGKKVNMDNDAVIAYMRRFPKTEDLALAVGNVAAAIVELPKISPETLERVRNIVASSGAGQPRR